MPGLSVKLEAPSSRSGVTFRQAMSRVSTGVAYGLATRIQSRVFSRGKTPQKAPPYDGDGIKLVSPRYDALGGRESRSGAKIFESTAGFHRLQATRPGSFNVSGGLARGLSVIPGRRDARVQFRGRSEGQEAVFKNLKRGTVARGRKVSNALKASTVIRATGVNILALQPQELEAISLAVQETARRSIPSIGGKRIRWKGGLSDRIARTILGAIQGLR